MNHYFENNEDLKSELRVIDYSYEEYNFSFSSDLGVFSKNHIDYGSKFLVETLLSYKKEYNNILDVGCGYGFIGIVLAKINNCKVDLIDINNRAVHLCKKNIKANRIDGSVFISNAYERVGDKYDLIITNPPIRAGKEVVLNILKGAKQHLTETGELWYVIRKDQGAKSIEKIISKSYNVDLIKKSKGFYVFCAKIIDKDGQDC